MVRKSIQVLEVERIVDKLEKFMNNSAKELELCEVNFNGCCLPESFKNTRRLRDILGMEAYTTIKILREKGLSKTKIAEMLGCSRKTVRKILKKLESGEEIIIKRESPEKMLDIYKDYIIVKVADELSATRIYQDLVSEKKYEGSYETVKIYVKDMKNTPDVYVRKAT